MMIIKRIVATLAFSAALLAGIPLATNAVAEPDTPECDGIQYRTDPIELHYRDMWTYTYTLTWCVEESEIVWVVPEVTHKEHVATCTWAGNMEAWERPEAEGGAWAAFNMSEFTCRADDGVGTRGVNPWALVNVYPDGSYRVMGKDIAE